MISSFITVFHLLLAHADTAVRHPSTICCIARVLTSIAPIYLPRLQSVFIITGLMPTTLRNSIFYYMVVTMLTLFLIVTYF